MAGHTAYYRVYKEHFVKRVINFFRAQTPLLIQHLPFGTHCSKLMG